MTASPDPAPPSHATPHALPSRGARALASVPLSILLLEDMPVTAEVVKGYLAAVAPTAVVEWAPTLADALARLERGGIDLVIADLNLPDSKGLATLDRVLAATDRLVVVLTSEDEATFEAAALERGVYDFLHKSRLSRQTLGQVVRLATMQAETLRTLWRALAERDSQRRRLDYLAFHDALTGLANRSLFLDRLGQALREAQAAGSKLVLALLDLERFRALNDAHGPRAGDAILRQAGERIARAAGRGAAARVGADQFAVLLGPVRGRSEAERRVARLLRDVAGEPFAGAGAPLEVSVRAGAARFPADAPEAESLLARAGDALRQGKAGGEALMFYAPAMTRWTAEALTLESKLRRALRRDEFELHYQPKVDAQTGRIAGVEALLRWRSPELGLVPPARFIPLMEETGLILEAGEWALRRAVADHGRWCALGLAAPRVAVNVSPLQLRKPDFAARVAACLEGARAPGAPAPALDLEITETSAMQGIEANLRAMLELRARGLRIAIDDFGTGYSSLAYLARLPVQQLKIDRSFVVTMLGDPATMLLVKTIIGLGRSLRVEVVAEGVDDEAQARALRELRCDELQGYLFSPPVPFEAMARLLEADAARR